MNFKILVYSCFIFTWIGNLSAQQLFEERKAEVEITKKALNQIYNFEFEEAEKNIQLLQNSFAGKPGADLLKSLHIYWKNFPLQKGTDPYKAYESNLLTTAEKAKEILDKNSRDVEGIFFSLAAHGYLAAYYADGGSIMKAVGHARKAYSSLKKGFAMKDELAEFQFTTGLYNYYREKYPENHPVFKPFTWFFESGNKKLGIDQLVHASENALFTKSEASYYLFHILLRYEKRPADALGFAKKLHETFPQNKLFLAHYVEALIYNGNFAPAEKLTAELKSAPQSFYRIPANLFMGMLEEKHRANLQKAKEYYSAALQIANTDASDTDYYKSLAHAGLARIADKEDDRSLAREHYKTSLKLATYDIVMDEANEYDR